MALRKPLGKRLFDCYRLASPAVTLEHSLLPPPSHHHSLVPPNAAKTNFHREYISSPESGDRGFFRRFLHRRAISQRPAMIPEFLSLPVGDKLREKLRSINISGDRVRFDGLAPPVDGDAAYGGFSVQDAKKLLRLSQVEKLKAMLREIPESSIPYSEFVRICAEGCGGNEDQGLEFAKTLDEAGNVIVLGGVVFLQPEQVAKSMETIISQTIAFPQDPRRKELEEMEKQKAQIDEKARGLVRGELYCGLGFLGLQTLGFMRLTFWELSWDVMEPICFFVTSLHFVGAYGFFLRTSKEPSFEGYFQRRFKSKQKRLMEVHGFDVDKYNNLRIACYGSSVTVTATASFGHDQEGALVGAMNR